MLGIGVPPFTLFTGYQCLFGEAPQLHSYRASIFHTDLHRAYQHTALAELDKGTLTATAAECNTDRYNSEHHKGSDQHSAPIITAVMETVNEVNCA